MLRNQMQIPRSLPNKLKQQENLFQISLCNDLQISVSTSNILKIRHFFMFEVKEKVELITEKMVFKISLSVLQEILN